LEGNVKPGNYGKSPLIAMIMHPTFYRSGIAMDHWLMIPGSSLVGEET